MHDKLRLYLFLIACSIGISPAQGMGLRSFVALPVDKGGMVARLQYQRNTGINTNILVTNAAYGLSGKQTLLFGLPYRLSPSGTDRTGDFSGIYRHIIRQDDTSSGTRRLGILGGAVIPTESSGDTRLQAGAVATFYQGRTEWDIDALWIQGLNDAANQARYDFAWQYRLSPAVYPNWGIGQEWTLDLELGGRWKQGSTMIHQVTLGLQSIHRQWVLEAGVVRDLNEAEDTNLIFSIRFHF